MQPYIANVLKKAIKTPKIYFRDTSLACYLTRWFTRVNKNIKISLILETHSGLIFMLDFDLDEPFV